MLFMFQEIVVFHIIWNSFVGFCFDFLILPLRPTFGMFLFSGQKIIFMSPVYCTTFIGSFKLSRWKRSVEGSEVY